MRKKVDKRELKRNNIQPAWKAMGFEDERSYEGYKSFNREESDYLTIEDLQTLLQPSGEV